MINHHCLSTFSYLGSAQRFTAVLEPISIISLRLAGCSEKKTWRIDRAPERINGLLHSGSLWLLPPIRLLYSFVSPPLPIIIKHAFLSRHRQWCVNVRLLMNLKCAHHECGSVSLRRFKREAKKRLFLMKCKSAGRKTESTSAKLELTAATGKYGNAVINGNNMPFDLMFFH